LRALAHDSAAWAERVRAQTFRLTPARPPADPWAAQALEELRHLRFALRDAELRRKPTGRLRTRCAEAERSIRERAWFRAGAGQSSPLATLGQTRAELGDRAMVRYLPERDDLTALVVTARKASIVHLGHCQPAAELCRRIQVDLDMLATSRLPDRLTTVVLGSLRRDAELLAQQMLAPLLPIIGDRELVILPSGFLYGVPWLQLPANQGRPVCRTGKRPACMTANSVIASAKRLMLVRHFCWKRRRMALISVPAWPIPIHQTKLMIPNAQPTGMLLPHIPMPFATVIVIPENSTPVPARPMRNSASHPRCGGCQT